MRQLGLSARGYHRVLRVARTHRRPRGVSDASVPSTSPRPSACGSSTGARNATELDPRVLRMRQSGTVRASPQGRGESSVGVTAVAVMSASRSFDWTHAQFLDRGDRADADAVPGLVVDRRALDLGA